MSTSITSDFVCFLIDIRALGYEISINDWEENDFIYFDIFKYQDGNRHGISFKRDWDEIKSLGVFLKKGFDTNSWNYAFQYPHSDSCSYWFSKVISDYIKDIVNKLTVEKGGEIKCHT